ncbi:hypothetical protein V6N13_084577 [Hibiscus sabdariffa]|uniref:LysM domain-containing protein n=1 Tax=Hibiscus sabdariffa TaxID=183260 RepID=A0ABR2T1F0_9ROSI
MAKSNRTAMIINFVSIVALLVIISMVESRGIGFPKGAEGPTCNAVHGVVDGDTCFDMSNTFNLSTAFFESINPNLDCKSLFVGQWICVAGSA